MDKQQLARIRRRIEDALRKTADWRLILELARMLHVKIDYHAHRTASLG